ncbi:MAG: mRNA-degrading endonuclease RelE of RelBE toxin-antitoxin system [Halieaceae bacterium]
MKATFKELPSFEKSRENYLSDEEYRSFQILLMNNPKAGDVIQGTGGLRKVRVASTKRGKGKRGGSRLIYYWYLEGKQFWLFTIYGKDEMSDLTAQQKRILKAALEAEVSQHGKA